MSSGTNPVGAWALTASTGASVQDPTTYKGAIDADFAVAQRVADAFAPKPSSPAAMSVAIDPGFIVSVGPSGLQSIVEIGAQSVTIAAAPGAPNNRIDLIVLDEASGSASVIAGTPAGTPVAPGLTQGKKQIAQVSVPNGTASIANANITDLRAVWQTTVPGIRWAIAGGAADAITASYTPANATLADGLILGFRATAANATTAPSFNADGLGAKTITKKGGQALLAGDIPGALAECLVRYNAANSRWELLNPAVAPVSSVFGRVGAVAATSGDYSVAQVTGAAPLASPTFTGVPAAPTPAGGTNTTQVATTAFVQTAVASATPPTTYGAVGTYAGVTDTGPAQPSWAGGVAPSVGSTGTISGLGGTWLNMGLTSGGYDNGAGGTAFNYLAVRIS